MDNEIKKRIQIYTEQMPFNIDKERRKYKRELIIYLIVLVISIILFYTYFHLYRDL